MYKDVAKWFLTKFPSASKATYSRQQVKFLKLLGIKQVLVDCDGYTITFGSCIIVQKGTNSKKQHIIQYSDPEMTKKLTGFKKLLK